MVDFLVSALDPTDPKDAEHPGFLEETLAQAGSAWQMIGAGGSFRLSTRVDPTTGAALAMAVGPTDRASLHLSTAHGDAYGRKPNPGAAYREAVRAVEAIAKPVILANDAGATWGR